ncbi:MAG: hypothetical protein HUJ70_09530, partial [Pseudobutyrivibrio sp.]|nr:hypothetical protein [Pseudobutyrivibrio sp.]
MYDVKLSDEYILNNDNTSEGTQIKYKFEDCWYKKDNRGSEGLCEYLAGKLLTFSDLPESDYVLYEQVVINDRPGCRSKDFLKADEEFSTLYRLFFSEYGKNISEVISHYDSLEDRVRYVIEYVMHSTGVDVSDYFAKVFTLDWIILNEDRHFNNLGLVLSGDVVKPAPIFDNGCSLLTANVSINRHLSVEENVKRVTAKPFSGSFDRQHEFFGDGFALDVDGALDWLKTEPESYE